MERKLTTKEEYLKRINVIVEYINNHLDENIDLGMLAEMSGFSPWHFHRIVRAFLGEPVGAFVTRVRRAFFFVEKFQAILWYFAEWIP